MKLTGLNGKLFLAGLSGAALLAACMMPNDSSSNSSNAVSLQTSGHHDDSGKGDSDHGSRFFHDGKSDDDTTRGGVAKVYVCHIPPGNPANAHTIHIGAPGVPAHLAHGDYLGQCKDSAPADHGHHGKKDNDGHHSHWGHGGKCPGHDSTGTGDTTVVVPPVDTGDGEPTPAPGDSGFAG